MAEKDSRPVVVVVGGAVAGSEAVFQLREKGIQVICIEQNPLPFGKIEDGLPRWHVEQRLKEEEKINERLDHPLVHFLPKTKLGRDITLKEILEEWKVTAVLLASGAWRDRPLGLEGVDQYIGKGLLYQNPLVYWFNHYHEASYAGQRYEISDGAMVVGGGLASMDVLKICQIELTLNALRKKGIQEEMLNLEKYGIPKALENHKLTWKDLGLKGTQLYYRRRIQDMPLADAADNPTSEQLQKTAALRERILNNFRTKYLFEFHDQHLPTETLVEGGRLVGLRFVQTKVEGKKAVPIPGTEKEVRASLIISSIGSIPEPIPGIPSAGEYYDVKDEDTGEVKGTPNLYALGNAVTGKGNIRLSLLHGRQVAKLVADKITADPNASLQATQIEKILERVQKRQKEIGFSSTYRDWVAEQIAKRTKAN